MELGLENKNVLVTGASRGIGYAIAQQFLSEGARVALLARGVNSLHQAEARLAQRFGASAVWSQACDCADATALGIVRQQVESRWGHLDVVVANVGDGRSMPDPIPPAEHWRRIWMTNFDSTLVTASTFLPMLQASGGCLLFISSIAGMEAIGAPVDYSTAKSAVNAFAKNLARKVAPTVRVNVIAPGNVFFPGGSWDEKAKSDPRRVEQLIESTVPMKRFGRPEEIADAAVFLCSQRASFVSGTVFVVDGGQTVGVS